MSLGLLGAYGSLSSSSSSEGEEPEDEAEEAKRAPPRRAEKLANPFGGGEEAGERGRSSQPSYMVQVHDFSSGFNGQKVAYEDAMSVFSNPYRAREERKRQMLEKHVEMTAKQEDQRTIGGKKVCWNFRRGRCRFGHKCTFAHDSDVAPRTSSGSAEENIDGPEVVEADAESRSVDSLASCSPVVVVGGGGDKRKARPGLSDSLVPGKKAARFYGKVYGGDDSKTT